MSRRIQGRVLTAAAMVAALALANPAHAAGRGPWAAPSGLFLQAWQWLAGALPGMGERGQGGTGARARHPILKAGAGVDPQGGSAAGMNGPIQSDGGTGVDPNG